MSSKTIYSRNCYTYRIGWTHLNIWYYGAKYGKESDPTKLWVSYFTSSDYVKKFRELHGEPDFIKVTKVFGDDTESCLVWETKFLTRIDAANRDNFLNKKNGAGKYGGTHNKSTAKDLYGNNLGIVSLDDPRWASGEIVGIANGKQFELVKIKATKVAKDQNDKPLGRVNINDPRWISEEITECNNAKSIKVNDIEYPSIKRFCTMNNISYDTYERIRDKSLDKNNIICNIDDYRYDTTIKVNGIIFESISYAAKELNVSINKLYRLNRLSTSQKEINF